MLRSLKRYYSSGVGRHPVVKKMVWFFPQPWDSGSHPYPIALNLWEEIQPGGGKHKVKKKYAYYTYIFTVNFSNQNINKNSFK